MLLGAASLALAQPALIATIPVGGDPSVIALNPNTNRLYVGQAPVARVDVVDTVTNTILSPIVTQGPNNNSIDVDSLNDRVYVAEHFLGKVEVFDGATSGKISEFNIGQIIFGVAVNSAIGKVYVVRSNLGDTVVLDGICNPSATCPVIPMGSDLSNTSSMNMAIDPTTTRCMWPRREQRRLVYR